MKKKLTKKDIKTIEEKTVFSVEDNGDYYSFGWYTDAGEDFSIEVTKGGDIIEEITNACDSFDAEEHVKMWIGGNGAPDVFTLCDDAKKIEEELENLAIVVNHL